MVSRSDSDSNRIKKSAMVIRLQISINSEYRNIPKEQMVHPVRIAFCSCVGIDPETVEVLDPDQLAYEIQIPDHDSETVIARIQREISRRDSVLNSLPITRRVFSGANIEIFVGPPSSSPLLNLVAPENPEFEDNEPLPMTTKLSLPPNSTHSPIRVVFVDGAADPNLEPAELDRSLLIQLPAQLVDEFNVSPKTAVIGKIDELLKRPKPMIPQSFSELKNLLVNYSVLHAFLQYHDSLSTAFN